MQRMSPISTACMTVRRFAEFARPHVLSNDRSISAHLLPPYQGASSGNADRLHQVADDVQHRAPHVDVLAAVALLVPVAAAVAMVPMAVAVAVAVVVAVAVIGMVTLVIAAASWLRHRQHRLLVSFLPEAVGMTVACSQEYMLTRGPA